MQLSTVLATVLTLAATGVSAATVNKARRQGGGAEDPVGAVGVFSNEGCEAEAQEKFLLQEVGQCITLEQGFGSAYLSPTHSNGEHFLVTFAGKNCSDIVTVTPPSRCAINLNDGEIWSVSAMVAPTIPGPPEDED